ncbi:hypothetical protein QJS66_16205 [Kocuria rhizophila]|nr:hypothetical protein QJS66_16205 [Kocuria rhizophila]
MQLLARGGATVTRRQVAEKAGVPTAPSATTSPRGTPCSACVDIVPPGRRGPASAGGGGRTPPPGAGGHRAAHTTGHRWPGAEDAELAAPCAGSWTPPGRTRSWPPCWPEERIRLEGERRASCCGSAGTRSTAETGDLLGEGVMFKLRGREHAGPSPGRPWRPWRSCSRTGGLSHRMLRAGRWACCGDTVRPPIRPRVRVRSNGR